MSVLVTGGSGCLGHHLLGTFTHVKGDLISLSLQPPRPYRVHKDVLYLETDLLDFDRLHAVLSQHKPQEIYHAAAQNSVGLSQQKPMQTLQTNILGTQNLFECVRKILPKSRILFISSCEVYGGGRGVVDTIHPETDPAIPMTPFATSKTAGELLAMQYQKAYKLDVVIARPFHFTGPFQSPRYVLPHVAQQLCEIEQDDRELAIYTGNLDVSRDYTDVRDVARALSMLMSAGKTGEIYNICSGKARTIRELVDFMISLLDRPIDIRIDPRLERQVDIPMLVGSPDKFMKLTGWRPLISQEDAMKDIYAEMKRRVKAGRKNPDYRQ